MEFILPDSVMNILSRLETDGFSAFVAGGAVPIVRGQQHRLGFRADRQSRCAARMERTAAGSAHRARNLALQGDAGLCRAGLGHRDRAEQRAGIMVARAIEDLVDRADEAAPEILQHVAPGVMPSV